MAQDNIFRLKKRRIIRVSCIILIMLLFATQILLGSSALVLVFALLALCISITPTLLKGVNLFTLIPLIFYFRYEGFALIFKTVLLQSLDSNLSSPMESYGLANLIMLAVAFASMAALRLAPRRQLLPEIQNMAHLRLVGVLATCVGVAGSLVGIFSHAGAPGGVTIGIGVFYAFFTSYPLLGIICEGFHTYNKTGQKTIFSWSLWLIFGLNLLIGMLNNARGGVIDAVVAIVILLILTRTFRPVHFMFGLVGFLIFQIYISPAFLEVRAYRTILSPPRLLVLTVKTTVKAVTDPTYLSELDKSERVGHRADNNIYDYYDNQSNIYNRLSWIGLFDQVYANSRGKYLLGSSVIEEMSSQLEPRFLFPDKKIPRYLYSDWLAFQYGFEPVGLAGALNFGLPMEGMVTIGLKGIFLYPFFEIFTILWAVSYISNWRCCGPYAIFFFVIMEERMIEMQSDELINVFLRILPVNCMIIYGLSRVAFILNASREAQGGTA